MAWEPSVTFVQQIMGHDRVMYAMYYPYQYVAEEVSAKLKELMSGAADLEVPLLVEVGVGSNWDEAH